MDDLVFFRELERCRYQAEELDNLVLALELARGLQGDADTEQRYHLGCLTGWIDDRLEKRRGDEGARVGVVGLPLLDERSGEIFLVQMEVCGEGEGHGPDTSGPFAAALDRAEAMALDVVLTEGAMPATAPSQRHGLGLSGPPGLAALQPDGGSAAAAAALALVSAWTGLPVPGGTVVTGALGPGGELLPVDHVAAKVACAVRENEPGARVFLPPGQGPDHEGVERAANLIELVAAVLGPLPASGSPLDIQGSVARGVWLYEKAGRFSIAASLLGHCLAAIRVRRALGEDPGRNRTEEVTCLWRRGSCLTHLGDEVGALNMLQQARGLAEILWAEGAISPADYLSLAGSLAVLLRDTLRYGEAEALLLDTLEQQQVLRLESRSRARTMGNLGELWTITGDYGRAEEILGEALEILSISYPDEVPRELCYLGNCALKQRRHDRALELYGRGLVQNREVEYGRDLNEAFLRYGKAQALRALGRPEEAVEEADRVLGLMRRETPYPRQLCLMVRGLCRLDMGQQEEGRRDLREAAHTSQGAGALLSFGLSTSLARLVIHLLRAGEMSEAGVAALDFVNQAAPYLDAYFDVRWSALMLEQLETDDNAATVAALERAIGLFPY